MSVFSLNNWKTVQVSKQQIRSTFPGYRGSLLSYRGADRAGITLMQVPRSGTV